MFSVQHDVLDNFLTLVNISSESGEEYDIIEYLVKRLKLYTRDVKVDSNGKYPKGLGNVIARIPGNKKYTPIIFCAHMDTVRPGKGISPQILNNIIKSDGKTILGADDKAGIASILTLLKIIHKDKLDCCPIEIIFTFSEENGLLGSRSLNFNELKSKIGFILDSDGEVGGAVIKAPSYLYFNISVKGKSAHSGMDAKNGINAIKIAADAISKIPTGAIGADTTINIGKIKGGSAINIVPDNAVIEYEIRSYSDKNLKKYKELIQKAFKDSALKYKGDVSILVEEQFLKYDFQSNAKTLEIFKSACKQSNITPRLLNSFGGSDANIFNANGIETLNISIGYSKPHTTDEAITLSALKNLLDVIYAIVKVCSK